MPVVSSNAIESMAKAVDQQREVHECTTPAVPLQDLAAGFMSGKLLLKLEAVTYLLQHHPAEHFAFLAEPGNMRARVTFYATLARLLFMDDTPAKFHSFVAPLQQVGRPAADGVSLSSCGASSTCISGRHCTKGSGVTEVAQCACWKLRQHRQPFL